MLHNLAHSYHFISLTITNGQNKVTFLIYFTQYCITTHEINHPSQFWCKNRWRGEFQVTIRTKWWNLGQFQRDPWITLLNKKVKNKIKRKKVGFTLESYIDNMVFLVPKSSWAQAVLRSNSEYAECVMSMLSGISITLSIVIRSGFCERGQFWPLLTWTWSLVMKLLHTGRAKHDPKKYENLKIRVTQTESYMVGVGGRATCRLYTYMYN